MPVNAFKYALGIVPGGYQCKTCNVRGCKLWRESHTFGVPVELLCCDCVSKLKKSDVSQIDSSGRVPWLEGAMRIDQFGGCVPAVPTEKGTSYWGYTSVPQAGCDWWKNLPTRI